MKFVKLESIWVQCIFSTYFTIATAAHLSDTFDFVIVGGGGAGNTLASRLSENGKHSVLLLEAGGIPHPDLDVPALSFNYLFSGDPNYIRTYQTVPQRNARLIRNGTVDVVSGRTLGGGTSVNGLFFNRGSPYDFNNWAEKTKDYSWTYSNMLPYFKKSENYLGGFPSAEHGSGGPITVSRPEYAPGLESWLDAGRALGYSIADPNGPQTISYTPVEFSKQFGRRVSSYAGYIRPVLGRRNLHIMINAEATQIVFDRTRAVGVRYTTKSRSSSYIRARKEIIISAGAIESPALLMKSGIGPIDLLKSAKITPIKDLPVGKNLHDHPMVVLPFILNNRSAVFIPERDLTQQALQIFNEYGDGPYSSYAGVFGQAYLKSPLSEKYQDWADVQLYYLGTSADLQGTPSEFDNFYIAPWEARVSGIKTTLATFEKGPLFRKLGARFPPNPISACQHHTFRSDEYWKCYIRQMATYGYHACGTCRMGSGPEDPNSVVDSELRVIGFQGLRVVDASIMPDITNTNLQAAVYAIAEKASDFILKSWSDKVKF